MKFTCFKLRRKSDERTLLANQMVIADKYVNLITKRSAKKKTEESEVLLPAVETASVEDFIDINAKTSSWYLPNVSAEKSAEILEALPVGRFVIRKSGNQLFLHLKYEADSEPKSFIIVPKENGLQFFSKHFSNLSSLVVHHSIMCEQLPTLLKVAEDVRDEVDNDLIDFIDIDVDPEFSDLVGKLKNHLTFV